MKIATFMNPPRGLSAGWGVGRAMVLGVIHLNTKPALMCVGMGSCSPEVSKCQVMPARKTFISSTPWLFLFTSLSPFLFMIRLGLFP